MSIRAAYNPTMTETKAETRDWAADMEQRLLDAALPLSGELGWSDRLTAAAGKAVGLSRAEAELLLPHGARDLAALLSRRHDQAGLDALAGVDAKALKIRERIRQGVEARVAAAMADEAATRRCIGFLALPTHLALGAQLVWESADAIWRWAGDTATDENHYSKRAILSGVLSSTLAVRLSAGAEAASLHLDRSIEGVMSYEKLKARFRGKDWAADIAGALGRMRFGT
jgi:ubiquinone biosynthesis protein COQ9